MADEKLVEELAEELRQQSRTERWIGTSADVIEFVLDRLAERGRLVPNGATLKTEWGVQWDAPGYQAPLYEACPYRERAEEICADRDPDEVDTPSLIHRTVITTPWAPVQPEPTPDTEEQT